MLNSTTPRVPMGLTQYVNSIVSSNDTEHNGAWAFTTTAQKPSWAKSGHDSWPTNQNYNIQTT